MRTGLLGALMDEYERALDELIRVGTSVDNDKFIDQWGAPGRLNSIQNILQHTCGAGYSYANYIRSVREIPKTSPDGYVKDVKMIEKDHQAMFEYTLSSVEGLYDLTEAEVYGIKISVWGDEIYHLEQLLEHAIVHILRHRRQIERILSPT